MQPLDLPTPSAAEVEQSEKLLNIIRQEIKNANGWISFEHYMQLALYAPGLGYYSGGAQKFGEQGDFITSPEVSPLFAQTFANPIAKLMADINDAKIIEFGAGSGKMAADLLLALQALNTLPSEYLIIELSAELQHRQKQTIENKAPDLLARVKWLSKLPENAINAIVIANEVLDAMPVNRFSLKNKQVEQLGVEIVDEKLQLKYKKADKPLSEKVKSLAINFSSEEHTYCSEINQHIKPWIKSLSQCLTKAAIYIVDYGYPRSEYYADDRHMGTCMGYYRHRSMDAPLWHPGLQDLTSFVDFTEVAEGAIENGFDVDGFTSQGNFLINTGLAEVVEQTKIDNEIQRLQIAQQMKTLSLPGEMGERFKVIGLSKGLTKNIPGFEVRDFRYRL